MKITIKLPDGREVERHKVCFGLRPDKNHKDILHGTGAVYHVQPSGALINLSKQGRVSKKQRQKLRKAQKQDTG